MDEKALIKKVKKAGIPVNAFATDGIMKVGPTDILHTHKSGSKHVFHCNSATVKHTVKNAGALMSSVREFATVYKGSKVYIFKYPDGACGALVLEGKSPNAVYALYLIPCNL